MVTPPPHCCAAPPLTGGVVPCWANWRKNDGATGQGSTDAQGHAQAERRRGGAFILTSSGFAVSSGLGKGGGGGSIYLEAFPTSPLILSPFNDPLTVPTALRPVPKAGVDGWSSPPGTDNQDFVKNATANKHQLWPGEGATANYPWATTTPDVYQIKLEVAGHDFTSSRGQPIDSQGQNVTPPGSANAQPRNLPHTTIYGFNSTFPGPMINA